MPVTHHDLNDVRIHAIEFPDDAHKFPSIVLDIDVWEFRACAWGADGENVICVRPALLKYEGVHDVRIAISGRGDPFLMLMDCIVEDRGDESYVRMNMIDGVSHIYFWAQSSELFPYGSSVIKNLPYLYDSERADSIGCASEPEID